MKKNFETRDLYFLDYIKDCSDLERVRIVQRTIDKLVKKYKIPNDIIRLYLIESYEELKP